MMDASQIKPIIPKPDRLRREIGIALLIKVTLLTGLWFLIFCWPGKPAIKPDIAAHFVQPALPSRAIADFSSQSQKENHHVR